MMALTVCLQSIAVTNGHSVNNAPDNWQAYQLSVSPLTHPALRWSVEEPLPFLPVVTDAPWQIIDKKKKGAEIEAAAEVETLNIQPGFVTAKGSVPVNSGKKQKHEEAEISIEITKIKKEVQIAMYCDDHYSPSELIWDGDNYGCAYNALFTILFEIWSTDVKVWTPSQVVLKNIWMVKPVLKQPEMLSDVKFMLKILQSLPMVLEAHVLQL